jgi:hypothetical protein
MVFIPTRIETREGREEFSMLQSDINLIYQNKTVTSLLDSYPTITLILNNFRQVVYCNRTYLELTSTDPQELVLGLRPGELFGCAYHNDAIDGCGEAEHCRYCGAVATIRESQVKREAVTKETRLTLINNKQEVSVDFKVTASPFELLNTQFTLVILDDISDSKRRKILEKVFFHDVIDKASSLQFVIDSAINSINTPRGSELISIARRLGQELVSEILGQRVLLNAENKELTVNLSKTATNEIIQRAIEQIRNHQISSDKEIIFNSSNNYELITDDLLLNRVLINMFKNALEASKKGEKVTLTCIKNIDKIEFCVHNNRAISENIQMQIFQRSFSTKGANRGVGTYSMKLLGEQFLKGKVWFESSAETGTFFYLSLPQKGFVN